MTCIADRVAGGKATSRQSQAHRRRDPDQRAKRHIRNPAALDPADFAMRQTSCGLETSLAESVPDPRQPKLTANRDDRLVGKPIRALSWAFARRHGSVSSNTMLIARSPEAAGLVTERGLARTGAPRVPNVEGWASATGPTARWTASSDGRFLSRTTHRRAAFAQQTSRLLSDVWHAPRTEAGRSMAPPTIGSWSEPRRPRRRRRRAMSGPEIRIVGGTLVDGTGAPGRPGTLEVRDGRLRLTDRAGARSRRAARSTPPARSWRPGSSTSTPTRG